MISNRWAVSSSLVPLHTCTSAPLLLSSLTDENIVLRKHRVLNCAKDSLSICKRYFFGSQLRFGLASHTMHGALASRNVQEVHCHR